MPLGQDELLLGPGPSGRNKHPSDWSRDGRFLLYADAGRRTNLDLWILPLAEGDRDPKARQVSAQIKSLIGVTCDVVVKSPGEVPRSQGKAVRVKDLRKKA